jgi:hypothetical protein
VATSQDSSQHSQAKITEQYHIYAMEADGIPGLAQKALAVIPDFRTQVLYTP